MNQLFPIIRGRLIKLRLMVWLVSASSQATLVVSWGYDSDASGVGALIAHVQERQGGVVHRAAGSIMPGGPPITPWASSLP